MTIQTFKEKLKNTPKAIAFSETMAVIEANYNLIAWDSKFSLTETTTVEGQFVMSDTKYPSSFNQHSPNSDNAWQIKLNHNHEQRNSSASL